VTGAPTGDILRRRSGELVSDSHSPPCVLVIADPERTAELVGALSEPLPTAVVSKIEVLASSGGDEAVELFATRRPHVVVVTATLETGDTAALVEAVRGVVQRAGVGIVVIGDPEGGAIRNAADASALDPDRFVSRPMAPRTLRFAVASALEAVIQARSAPALPPLPPLPPLAPALPPVPPVRSAEAEAPAAEAGPAGPAAAPGGASVDATREALRRRWAALADSMADEAGDLDEDDAASDEPAPLPPPIEIRPRVIAGEPDAVAPPQAWSPGTTSEISDVLGTEASGAAGPAPEIDVSAAGAPREPTLIIHDPSEVEPAPLAASLEPAPVREAGLGPASDSARIVAARETGDSGRIATGGVPSRDSGRIATGGVPSRDSGRIAAGRDAGLPPVTASADLDLPLDSFGDDLILTGGPRIEPRLEVLEPLPLDGAPPAPSSTADGRDFARQLRAKMSQMAQRLFQGADAPAPAPADLVPRHDHSTEIDLAALGEEPPLAVTEIIEVRTTPRPPGVVELATLPGSWDSQVRERGLPDQGEIVRGVSDAPMLLAKMFAGGSTGRIAFRRGDVETVVFFDLGRPVFASSSEARDRMGELLVREGKITAAQYERVQGKVAESGRRMGEILVDLGYLKRRELLPAVRRHVEDIVYALFGWDRGRYQIAIEAQPCAERIRLSRHPAALILEGIRRKLNRSTLERLVGPPSTVIEVGDRERLGGIINMGDLTGEERAALAAFDGQADLAGVARTAGVDIADVLPIAWGLCVLGLATTRRTDTDVHDESTALVGETDLAIDRARVRARWQLVTEADYFALLGVRRDATAFEIRRAYQAARRDFAAEGFPPDLRRELARELDDIASVLDEAFRVLRDDRLRQTYLANLIE
jgi:DNA-binding NarL/FixJ family response regulator